MLSLYYFTMEGGETVVFNLELMMPIKAGKPHNGKTCSHTGNIGGKGSSFESILSQASGEILKDTARPKNEKELKNGPIADLSSEPRVKDKKGKRPVEMTEGTEEDIKGTKPDSGTAAEETSYAPILADSGSVLAYCTGKFTEGSEEALEACTILESEVPVTQIKRDVTEIMDTGTKPDKAPMMPEMEWKEAWEEENSESDNPYIDLKKEISAVIEEIMVRNKEVMGKNEEKFEKLMDGGEHAVVSTVDDEGSIEEALVKIPGKDGSYTAGENAEGVPAGKKKMESNTHPSYTASKTIRVARSESAGSKDEAGKAENSNGKEAIAGSKDENANRDRYEGVRNSFRFAERIMGEAKTTKEEQAGIENFYLEHKQVMAEDKQKILQSQVIMPKSQLVGKNGVISQIVKKAEIIAGDLRQEMRIQLEPENLGKLTLKVSVEKGLVTAKFVAESYEVKQAIESGFKELKDMLLEKGLAVQNLSVSVGQEQKGYFRDNSFGYFRGKSKSGSRGTGPVSDYDSPIDTNIISGKGNPYIVHTGQFDHRA